MKVAHYQEAAELLQKARRDGIPVDARMFEILMEKAPRVELVREHMRDAQDAGCGITSAMFASLLDKCDQKMATEAWLEMKRVGIEATARAYAAHMKSVDFDTACKLYEQMITDRRKPNREVFRQLILKAPVERKSEFRDAMASFQLTPNVAIYEALIHGAATFVIALGELTAMLTAGLRPTRGVIMEVAGRVKGNRDIRELIRTLRDFKCAISGGTSKALARIVRAYCLPRQASRLSWELSQLVVQEQKRDAEH